MPKTDNKKRVKDEAADARRAASRQEQEEAEYFAAVFKALGDPTRLRIVLFLRDAAAAGEFAPAGADLEAAAESDDGAADNGGASLPGGATVGEITDHLTGSDKVSSNVSHHLKELRHAGLIAMKRRGKNILCRVEEEALVVLARLLVEPRK